MNKEERPTLDAIREGAEWGPAMTGADHRGLLPIMWRWDGRRSRNASADGWISASLLSIAAGPRGFYIVRKI